eukprot:gene31572-39734_t
MTRVDVSCTEDLASTTSSPYGMRFPIGGIMHTAGILQDAVLANQTAGSIYGVLAPKLGAAAHMSGSALSAHPLDVAVAFSSVAALVGSAGQASYS